MLAALGLGGNGGQGKDEFYKNLGTVPQNEKPEDIDAKALPMSVRGERQDKGEESYVEIKAPVAPGQRSSTPYSKVLPKYRKQAEEAMRRQQIPKDRQKAVKDYFDSLGGGR